MTAPKTIDLMSVLVNSLREPEHTLPASLTISGPHRIERDAAAIAFPRASAQQSVEYFGLYRRDAVALMKVWLVQTFAALAVKPTTDAVAIIVAKDLAEREILRSVNAHEERLIGEVCRDWITGRDLMARVDRERAREIL